MGGKSSKNKPIVVTDHTIEIKTSYLVAAKQIHIDREVNTIERDEYKLLEKYNEKQRTLDDMFFRDELMMCAVNVRKVTAMKKAVIYVRFLGNAKKFIADSKGVFEKLPDTSKTSVKNIIFAAKHLPDKELTEFAIFLQKYFQTDESVQMAQIQNSPELDADLKKECLVVKNQTIPDSELIDYYIEYMKRNGLTPVCGNFGRTPVQNIGNPQGGNFGGNFQGGNFGGNFGGGGGMTNFQAQGNYGQPQPGMNYNAQPDQQFNA